MKVLFKIYVCFCIVASVYGQAPVIVYPNPNTFALNQTITPLAPNNSGGNIPGQPIVTTFAGSGTAGFIDAVGAAAKFNLPTVVTPDHLGNIIVVDRSNHRIRKITPDGTVSTIAGTGVAGALDGLGSSATFRYPDGAVVDSQGNIFISDQSNHKIRKITSDGTVSTFAGSGTAGFLDGTGTAAKFYYPAGMAVDANDNLYVADYSNQRIRKITPDGVVTTYAGLASAGATDGNVSIAKFNGPTGVGVDASGTVFVADYGNHKIRRISITGEVTTVAGTGIAGAAEGTATTATFNHPAIVAVDASNNLFITDQNNHKIRKINALGEVSTFAGAGIAGAVEGNGDTATFNSPTGVCVGNSGEVYVSDYANHKIRKIATYGYTIVPNLPDGLFLDPVTGVISGTPTVTSPMTVYTVTATNESGTGSFVVNIEVGTLGTEEFNSNNVKVYPNPVYDRLFISNTEKILSVSVFDLLQQKVKDFTEEEIHRPLDLQLLSKGVYLLRIGFTSGSKEIRIIKQ